MRRIGLFLMAMFLAGPMVRECCLPTVTTQHCDESKDSDHPSPCSSSPVAVAENKTTVEFSTLDFGLADSVVRNSNQIESATTAADELTFLPRDTSIDLYLRTGALLI